MTKDQAMELATAHGLAATSMSPEDEEEQHQAVMALRADDPDAIAKLVRAFGSASWRVRRTAVETMRHRFSYDLRLLPALVQGLASADNAGLRNTCAAALVEFGEAAVDELDRAMFLDDLDLTTFAIEVLGAIGTDKARARLMRVFEQPDSNVRLAVVEALGHIGGDAVIDALLTRLSEVKDDLQLAAYILDALARCRAQLDFDEVHPWLELRSLSRFVYPLLALTCDTRAIEALVQGTTSRGSGARKSALRALGDLVAMLPSEEVRQARLVDKIIANEGAIATLEEGLESEDDSLAEAAVRVFGVLGQPDRAPQLLTACSGRTFVRAGVEAVTAMGSAAVPSLLNAIDSAGAEARLLFLEAVETAGDHRATLKLLELTEARDSTTAAAAIRALGRVGAQDVIAPLMDIARADDPDLSREAAFALSNLGTRHTQTVADSVRSAIAESDVRPAWLWVLGALAREGDTDVIIAAGRHHDPHVRRAALEAAQNFGCRIPAAVLMAALDDRYAPVRAAAAKALAAYRSDTAVNALLRALSDRDPWVASAVARSLAAVDHPMVERALSEAAASFVGPVAIAAIQGLFRLNPTDLEHVLKRACAHPDSEVVREAVNLTQKLPASAATDLLTAVLRHPNWAIRWAAADTMLRRNLRPRRTLLRYAIESESETIVRDLMSSLEPDA